MTESNTGAKRPHEAIDDETSEASIDPNNISELGQQHDMRTAVSGRTFGGAPHQTTAYFKDLERYLIKHITESDVVAGAVAWLTSESIIATLAQKRCALVVQKEDFLRPDLPSSGTGDLAQKLAALYTTIKHGIEKQHLAEFMVSHVSSNLSLDDPIRCVGNLNTDKNPAHPKMHNKFLVFCKERMVERQLNPTTGEFEWTDKSIPYGEWTSEMDTDNTEWFYEIHPYAVWTGSFNFTQVATHSFENAVYIENDEIATAYMMEFGHIYALSEPLNWQSEWMEPQFRIGT